MLKLRHFVGSKQRHLSSRPLGALDASRLTTRLNTELKPKPSNAALCGAFGRNFADHMLVVDWNATKGWHAPSIEPYADFSISPAAMALHYGLQCFEGMKAYRGEDGRVRLFRPELNMARMNRSLARLRMPAFEGSQFIELLKALLRLDESWVPTGEGHSAYLRPTAIATDPFLGVAESKQTRLFALVSPVGPYYPDGFKPIAVLADAVNVRAWPGGSGDTKIGGNYGPSIKPQVDALAKTDGVAQQVLYLFGEEQRVTEVGAMNVFVLWRRESDGKLELITPPLDFGDILPGVTRRSVIELARGAGATPLDTKGEELLVSERAFTMPDLARAQATGRLLEVFGCGTAAVICPIHTVFYQDTPVVVPTGADIGPIARQLFEQLSDIHYGRDTSTGWSMLIDE